MVISHGKPAGEKPAVFAFAASNTASLTEAVPVQRALAHSAVALALVLVMQDGGPLLPYGLLDGEARVVIQR